MALKLVYGPYLGPYEIEDTDTSWYPDGLPMGGARSEAQIYVEAAPIHDWHVARRMDIDATPGNFYKAGADSLPTDAPISDDLTTLLVTDRVFSSAAFKMVTGAGLGKHIESDADGNFSWESTSALDHGGLSGLLDDDHTQYLLRNQWNYVGFLIEGDNTISFVDGSRTFTITPVGPSFTYFFQGVLKNKTVAESFIISDVTGYHLIYYDNLTLTEIVNPNEEQIDAIWLTKSAVAAVYWDATAVAGKLFDERHKYSMPPEMHHYAHDVIGAAYLSGLALGNFSVDGSGDLAAHAQFSTDSGVIYDEDLRIEIDAVGATTGLEVWYLLGTTWKKVTNAGFSVLTTGTGRLAYNPAGALTEVSNTNFCLYHVFSWNATDSKPISIMGQAQYATLAAARAGALVDIGSLNLTGLLTRELKPIGTFILQTDNGYANAVKGRIRSTAAGGTYVDWRVNPFQQGAPAVVHNSLSGLQGGTTNEYYHLTVGQHTALTTNILTVSRLLVTDASGYLASNGALTTNKLTKAVSSGASLADSSITDNGTTVTISEPIDISGAAAGQIKFPATQNASGDANTLDDYEEGIWTIGVSFGGGTTGITYGNRFGGYVKIGNMVYITGFLSLTSKGTDVGAAVITGLPFTTLNAEIGYAAALIRFGNLNYVGQFQAYYNFNSTVMTLQKLSEAGVLSNLTDANFTDTTDALLGGSYRVAS